MAIDVRKAVNIAMQYAVDLLGPDLVRLQLEEVELNDNATSWLVTVGFDEPRTESQAAFGKPERKYKVIEVSTSSGEPKSIRIRRV